MVISENFVPVGASASHSRYVRRPLTASCVNADAEEPAHAGLSAVPGAGGD